MAFLKSLYSLLSVCSRPGETFENATQWVDRMHKCTFDSRASAREGKGTLTPSPSPARPWMAKTVFFEKNCIFFLAKLMFFPPLIRSLWSLLNLNEVHFERFLEHLLWMGFHHYRGSVTLECRRASPGRKGWSRPTGSTCASSSPRPDQDSRRRGEPTCYRRCPESGLWW